MSEDTFSHVVSHFGGFRFLSKKQSLAFCVFFPAMAVSVYRTGFKAELIGRMKTAVHAYTSPEISPSPVCAKIPEKV